MKTKREYIAEALSNLGDAEIVAVYNEYAEANNYERIYRNDEYFWEEYVGSISELAQRIGHQFYNYNHTWVMIDNEGDFVSFNDPWQEIDIDDVAKWVCRHTPNNAVFNIRRVEDWMEEDFKEELALMGYNCDTVDEFTDYDSDLSFEDNLAEFKMYLEERNFSDVQCEESEEKVEKYYVSIPFEGSLNVMVEAHNEDEALEIGRFMIEDMSNDKIIESAEFGSYEVQKA
jgi:hypothetical protein